MKINKLKFNDIQEKVDCFFDNFKLFEVLKIDNTNNTTIAFTQYLNNYRAEFITSYCLFDGLTTEAQVDEFEEHIKCGDKITSHFYKNILFALYQGIKDFNELIQRKEFELLYSSEKMLSIQGLFLINSIVFMVKDRTQKIENIVSFYEYLSSVSKLINISKYKKGINVYEKELKRYRDEDAKRREQNRKAGQMKGRKNILFKQKVFSFAKDMFSKNSKFTANSIADKITNLILLGEFASPLLAENPKSTIYRWLVDNEDQWKI